VFKNIRFAAPPVGQLRYAKPVPPAVNATLQTGAYGPACTQYVSLSMLSGMGSVGSALGSLLGNVDLGALTSGAKETGEDCLFLDVYVPRKALEGKVKLPVVNWIYGGAYLLGSKEGRVDGAPLIRASGGNMIFIAANYRVGIFGFLAGSTVEKEGTPNAGLYDQRAVLEWIQKFGPLFGGDVDNVSVWGESAGAGSIVHQLTAFGGRGAGEKPLFKQAVIQSPAFDAQVDRRGQLEQQFQEIATLAGCAGKGLACLRAADLKTLKTAQDRYVASMPGAKPGIGYVIESDS
jgi:carboxylesterase type B